jgi:hypothetical protein
MPNMGFIELDQGVGGENHAGGVVEWIDGRGGAVEEWSNGVLE